MSNRQVIAIFILGIALLLVAFWAGLTVIKQGTAASAKASVQKPQQPRASAAVEPQPDSNARYLVFVAAFGTLEKAKELEAELRRAKYLAAYVQMPDDQNSLYRVSIGPYTKADADKVADQLLAEGRKGLAVFSAKQ